MLCELCDGDGAQPIVVEVGRHALRVPTVRTRVLCFPCTAHGLLHARPDDAAELCSFIGKFQFGVEHPTMASYKEIEKMMSEITADLLVNDAPKKGGAWSSKGDATYRYNQLRLLAEIAKSLDSIAYNAGQMRENGGKLVGVLSKLEGHYAAMLKMQQRKNGPQQQAGGKDADRQQS